MKTYKITVMTPTYNRAYSLPRLYESLKNQSTNHFEWLIVDDGSTDNTMSLVENWIVENELQISYLKVKNGGKHRAINKATTLARGELFFIVDSDDYLTPTALAKIITWEATLSDAEKKTFAGVAGNVGYSKDSLVGTTFTGEYIDATSLEREKYAINGDKAEVFYTHLLRKYKFPEIEGENFITEFVVWFHIAHDGHKIRWFNDIIYICEYLEDGLTKNAQSIAIKNPKGYELAQQLYQKFYGGYLQQEKEAATSQLHHLILVGDLEAGEPLFNSLPDVLKKDLNLRLLLIQVYLYQQNLEKAHQWLDQLELLYPKQTEVFFKIAILGKLKHDPVLEVNAIQKAAFYSQDQAIQQDLLARLRQKYELADKQILTFNYPKVKQLFSENKIEDCEEVILGASGFDETFQLELLALEGNPILKEFIVRLLVEQVEGFTVDQSDLPYVYGHIYYEGGQYPQSLLNLEQIAQQNLTPLSAYRLAKIYQLSLLAEKARVSWNHYLQLKDKLQRKER